MNDIVACRYCRSRIIPTSADLCPACGHRPDTPPDAREIQERAALRLARRRRHRRILAAAMLVGALAVAVVGLILKITSGGEVSGWFVGATVLLALVGLFLLATAPRQEA